MARAKKGPRFVLTDAGKVRLRRAVAYEAEKFYFDPRSNTPPQFMLSVYAYTYKYQKTDDTTCWTLLARMKVLRSTTKSEQAAFLEVLTYRAALEHNFDYVVEIEANTKMPTKVKIIDRRE